MHHQDSPGRESRWSWDFFVWVSPSFCGPGVISSPDPETSIKKAYDSDCTGDEESSAFLNVCGIVLGALMKPWHPLYWFQKFPLLTLASHLQIAFCLLGFVWQLHSCLNWSFRSGFISSRRLKFTSLMEDPAAIAWNSQSIEVNKKFPVWVGVSILPFLAVTLLNEAYMR